MEIPEGWVYEDQLPEDLSNEDYDDWFPLSRVIDGVRMGPPFPLPPVECVEARCRFCGARVVTQSDNPEPECDACDEKETESLRDSFAIEDQLINLTGSAREL